MNIQDVVGIAQRVHDAERMNFGASSSREERNRNWARIIGIVHWGHATYNPTPDPQWHIKNAGGGRPQSDDVAVSMPSRHFWDCIPGSGANGYSFRASGDHGPLSSEQHVYAPPRPDGAPVHPTPPPPPPDGSLDVIDAIARIQTDITARRGGPLTQGELNELAANALRLGWPGGTARVPEAVFSAILVWARQRFAGAVPPVEPVNPTKAALLEIRHQLDAVIGSL